MLSWFGLDFEPEPTEHHEPEAKPPPAIAVAFPRPGIPVVLQVYDSGGAGRVNALLHPFGTGAFHAGVELYGKEWSFSASAIGQTGSGIFWCLPLRCPNHAYRESIHMGYTHLHEEEVYRLIAELQQEWMASSYDLLSKNCCHFSDILLQRLGCPPCPAWVLSLATTAKQVREGASQAAEQLQQAVEAMGEAAMDSIQSMRKHEPAVLSNCQPERCKPKNCQSGHGPSPGLPQWRQDHARVGRQSAELESEFAGWMPNRAEECILEAQPVLGKDVAFMKSCRESSRHKPPPLHGGMVTDVNRLAKLSEHLRWSVSEAWQKPATGEEMADVQTCKGGGSRFRLVDIDEVCSQRLANPQDASGGGLLSARSQEAGSPVLLMQQLSMLANAEPPLPPRPTSVVEAVRSVGSDRSPSVSPKASFSRASEFTVQLNKGSGESLGVDVDHSDGSSLHIEGINPGMIQSWNLAHEQQIRVGDRIVAVNGKRGKVEDLVQECIRARLEMELTIRPSASVIASRSRPTMASSEP
eukprot:TRINITY_DN30797_c0_g1_i1.p1 TRINITY_DN30797_c0_g1~~TRINITY_DN30797_c0_g1_i1.p1  ORF type:complete len:525 (-),score=128.34 TRINITY_DN30797_c0_g1_i1:176-1750(-)